MREFRARPGDKQANLRKIEANVAEAAHQGANLVAFPEEAIVGAAGCPACRTADGPCDAHLAIAETVPGPSTDRLAALAKKHEVYVVAGMAEKDADDPSVLYNAAAVVGWEASPASTGSSTSEHCRGSLGALRSPRAGSCRSSRERTQ